MEDHPCSLDRLRIRQPAEAVHLPPPSSERLTASFSRLQPPLCQTLDLNMDELQYNRDALKQEGSGTEAVDILVTKIALAHTTEEAQTLLNELEPEANKLRWPRDRDYAAVALQYASAQAIPSVCKEMLKFALGRAQWCASCATAGGEGITRSRHIHELEALLYA